MDAVANLFLKGVASKLHEILQLLPKLFTSTQSTLF